ncbi:hypothetical protein [Kozakia baliensis]|uniref:hypothetical protein n=1 Tax=Kozakia baliensis TaxID=153496 RepID=UPI00087AA3B8|nr:hypothetical protein [Kozakia baliensis]AOX21451.1 hypothetical protein A0U90_13155 [Kozakia baliensis]
MSAPQPAQLSLFLVRFDLIRLDAATKTGHFDEMVVQPGLFGGAAANLLTQLHAQRIKRGSRTRC